MAFSWATKRRFLYSSIVFGVFFIIAAIFLYSWLDKPPSCFDNKKNQNEFGVDCGGPCDILCKEQVADLTIKWSRSIGVSPGLYDVVALIENPNTHAGIEQLPYTFTLYDGQSIRLSERTGETYVNPGEAFVLFESGIKAGARAPARTFVEFSSEPVWRRAASPSARINVKNQKFTGQYEAPRLQATLENNLIQDLFDVEVFAVVFNEVGNAVATSRTKVDMLPRGGTQNITFTWPRPISVRPEPGSCTAPADVVLVIDRSESMMYDSPEPPQPLTDSKAAASIFVDSMKPGDQVGVVSFATAASFPLDQELTRTFAHVKASIANIYIHEPTPEQHTNLGDGIEKTFKELISTRHSSQAKRAVVALTDGVVSRPLNPNDPTDNTIYPQNYAEERAMWADEEKIRIYVIGLGNRVDATYLSERVASTPEHYYAAADASKLAGIYREIAQAVCEDDVFTSTIYARTNVVSSGR